MDLPHTHIINPPFDTDITYDHAFYGGTSLLIRKESIKLLKLLIPQGLDLTQPYFVQVTVKGTQGVNLVCKYTSKKEEERIFTAKSAGS